MGHQLKGGQSLSRDEKLTSQNGRFELVNHFDNAIILHDTQNGHNQLWSVRTAGWPDVTFKILPNSRVVVLADSGQDWEMVMWGSCEDYEARSEGDTTFTLQDDGNAVVTWNGEVVWSTNTTQRPPQEQSSPTSTNDRLKSGSRLGVDQSLCSPNGRFKFTLCSDGNARLFDSELDNKEIWVTGGGYEYPRELIMQDDGNLVIYGNDSGDSLWASGSRRDGDFALIIQDDGNAVIKSNEEVIWQTRTWIRDAIKEIDCLKVGQALNRGDSLLSSNRRYRLRMQEDRNLVLYDEQDGNRAIWELQCRRPGRDNFKLIVTDTGSLELWDDGECDWSSRTDYDGDGSTVLRVHDIGIVALYSRDQIIWKSTSTRSALSPDEELRRGEKLHAANLDYVLTLSETGLVISTQLGQLKWSQSNLGLSDCQLLTLVDAIPARLEIKNSGAQVIWTERVKQAESPRTWGAATTFVLENDGEAYLWWNRQRWWTTSGAHNNYSPPSLGATLEAGQILLAGDYLTSKNGAYRCTYRYDGSLAVTDSNNNVIWSSKTEGCSTGQITQQRDGNLVIMNRHDKVVFSGTGGYPDRYFPQTTLQDDGELVTMVCGWKIWGSKSFEKHKVRGADGLPIVFEEGTSDRSHFTPAPMRPDWIDKAKPCSACGFRYCTRVHFP